MLFMIKPRTSITPLGNHMKLFMDWESDSPNTTDEVVRRNYERALAEFIEARDATLSVDIAGMGGMSAAHEMAMRFEMARTNRAKWANCVANL